MPSNWRYPKEGIIPLPYHHTMLADQNRCLPFQRAIQRHVGPNDVVFEPGAGTGILAYFAAQQARKVYAMEADPQVAELGARLIELNGLAGRVDYQHGLAEEHLPDEPIDVLVCEMMHVALAVEQQVPVLNRVHRGLRQRYPGHPYRAIPEGAVNYCQLIQASFDFYGFQAPFVRLGNPYIPDPSLTPLSAIAPYFKVDFHSEIPEHVARDCRVEANASGELNAIRILTQAVLSFDGSLPADQALIDWYLHFLLVPLPRSYAVSPGSAFSIELEYDAGCPLEEIRMEVREL